MFELLVAVLACYRLTSLLVHDDGPFDLFLNLRTEFGVYDYDQQGKARTTLGRLFGCPYCLGFWVAIPFAFWLWNATTGSVVGLVVLWFATAGGQSLVQGISRRGEV